MRIDADEFDKALKYWNRINECNIEDVRIYRNGRMIIPEPTLVRMWKWSGLNTTDFVEDVVSGKKIYDPSVPGNEI